MKYTRHVQFSHRVHVNVSEKIESMETIETHYDTKYTTVRLIKVTHLFLNITQLFSWPFYQISIMIHIMQYSGLKNIIYNAIDVRTTSVVLAKFNEH